MLESLFGTCSEMECSLNRTRVNAADRPFNLSVLVHSAVLDEVDGPGLVQSQQPVISLSVGNSTKESEPGAWSKEKGQWCFREALTMRVSSSDDIALKVLCTTQFGLMGISSPSMNARCAGERSFNVSEVLPRLRTEDRDAEGFVYATPVITYDLLQERRTAGRVYLSFETKTPVALLRQYGESALSDMGTDARWDGPVGWKRDSPNKQMSK